MLLEDWEVSVVERHLQDFAGTVDGVRAAVVASVDGFSLAQAVAHDGGAERLAAMTSAMLALATAVGRELSLGQLEVLMLDASEGKVLMLSMPLERGPLLLMTACDNRSIIGNVIWSAKECSRKLLLELGGR